MIVILLYICEKLLIEFFLYCLEQIELRSINKEIIELRSINKEIIELVLLEPDQIILEIDNQKVYQKIIEKYLYRIFVNNDKKPPLIKTIYRTSKINKYL